MLSADQAVHVQRDRGRKGREKKNKKTVDGVKKQVRASPGIYIGKTTCYIYIHTFARLPDEDCEPGMEACSSEARPCRQI